MFRSAKNIVKNENISMFDEDFEERYDVEQYCWTKNTIERLLQLDFTDKTYLESYGNGNAASKILDTLINLS